MEKTGIENRERRNFLQMAPVAALAGIGLLAKVASSQSAYEKFEVITAESVEDAIKALQASPGNKTLYESPLLTLVLTSEKEKSAKEFEWHEHRDHVFHILDGSTMYELGGTPKNAHSKGPGEWLAPESEGATTVELKQGEFLVVPRGTPHRRTTKESVLLALMSPQTT